MQDATRSRRLAGVIAALAVLGAFAFFTGILGIVLLLMLMLVSAVLYAAAYAIAPKAPGKGRQVVRRLRLAMAGALGLATLAFSAYGLLSIVRFAGDRAELPIPDRYVVVVVVDGGSLLRAKELLLSGLDDPTQYMTGLSRSFPHISETFLRNGAFTAYGVCCWPSSSVPAHTAITTGCYPRRTGIMGMRQFDPKRRKHTSYIGLGILEHRRLLRPGVRTLNEYFPKVRSLDVLQISNRGSSLFIPSTPHDELAIRSITQVVRFTGLVGRLSRRSEIPRIVIVTLPDIDHQTHNALLSDANSSRLYLKADDYIGELTELYRSKGILDKTLFVLCADHAMGRVENHVTLDNVVSDLRFQPFRSLKWSLVPAWGSFEANFWVGWRRQFDRTYDAVALWGGNSDALVYLKGQEADASGKVIRESWDLRPTDERLASYHVGGTTVDVIRRLIDYSPGVGLIFTNSEPGTYHVYSRAGQGRIRERRRGRELEFQYTLVDGRDPLGYAANPTIAPYMRRGAWLSDEQWAALTYLEHYPDALRRMSATFGQSASASLHIVATDGWDFTPYYVARHVLVGSHGSLNREQSLVPIMFAGPGIARTELACARTVDIVPTILAYFGVDAPDVDGRVLPIFADEGKNRSLRTDPANRFTLSAVEDARFRYKLESYYGVYDRGIVRVDKATGRREVLVESVRDALPDLRRSPNATLSLAGLRPPHLLLRTAYLADEEDTTGPEVRFDVVNRAFEPAVPAAASR